MYMMLAATKSDLAVSFKKKKFKWKFMINDKHKIEIRIRKKVTVSQFTTYKLYGAY